MPTPSKATLNEAAVVVHELFMSYLRAGFTRDEALRIVIGMNDSAIQSNRPDAP